MNNRIVFSKDKKEYKFQIFKESPFFVINDIKFISKENKIEFTDFLLKYFLSDNLTKKGENGPISILNPPKRILIDKNINIYDTLELKLEILKNVDIEFELEVYYSTDNLISIPNYLEDFENYFENYNNVKILFMFQNF